MNKSNPEKVIKKQGFYYPKFVVLRCLWSSNAAQGWLFFQFSLTAAGVSLFLWVGLFYNLASHFLLSKNLIFVTDKMVILFLLQLHILEIRHIPEALPYFVTPKAIDENSTLLQQLPHWAACSITQALEFLTPAYKGHPRVMAYVLRVLESYPPQRVTFFMPQLVQALRYDDEVRFYGHFVVNFVHCC